MEFDALYHKNLINVINPNGDTGVVTLWSNVGKALQMMDQANIDLSPERSRIAAVSNLYGNGLPHMLRNLQWNPQIRHIVIMGKDLSGSKQWLLNFFENGLEEVDFLGAKAFRIRGTGRVIDGYISPKDFGRIPQFLVLGDIGDPSTGQSLKEFFIEISSLELDLEIPPRKEPPSVPEPTVTRFPSEARSHTINRSTPMSAWRELVFRLYRFGHRTTVHKRKGPETRIELQNIKVVIDNPREESEEILAAHGFSLERFLDYQQRILDPVLADDLTYTYGNLMRAHFEYKNTTVDSLQIVADRLKSEADSRHAYIALWDNSLHLPEGTNCPCFVSAFFRKFEGKLTLTASFRTQNTMSAWPENLYGLIAIQRFVAEYTGMEPGPITVLSHSISIDPSGLDKAEKIAANRETDDEVDSLTGKVELRLDPHGEFTVTFDREKWELIVEHSFGGMKIGEYRGKTAEEIERQLARDCAVSLISHALYLGRELARKQAVMLAAKLEELKA